MRIAYLDCFSGISGDMFLGALVDAGVPTRVLEETVAALNIGAQLEISRVNRSGISAMKVDVYSHGEKDLPREEYWAQQDHKQPRQAEQHDKKRAHKHEHRHHHGHELHEHLTATEPRPAPPAPHGHERSHGRSLHQIEQIISAAKISAGAKKTSITIFEALGAAEAKIHNCAVDRIHFHEVGAVDAMVDIVCAAVGAEALGVDEFVCSPLNVGGGTVKCAHGTLPVPAPATVELLRGAPVYSSDVEAELVTPTGAAIVKTLAKRFSSFPEMKIQNVGYGAGTRDFSRHANVVRITVGEAEVLWRDAAGHVSAASVETIGVLEANVDDLNPQVFGYVMDRLLEQGALDVFGMPVQMKKNRPGMLLTVLCRPQDAGKLSQLVFSETTTLGVRQRLEDRQALARRWVKVATQWGEVRLKIASMNGTVTNYAPEYEDCRRLAVEHQVPLKTVIEAAVQAYLEKS